MRQELKHTTAKGPLPFENREAGTAKTRERSWRMESTASTPDCSKVQKALTVGDVLSLARPCVQSE